MVAAAEGWRAGEGGGGVCKRIQEAGKIEISGDLAVIASKGDDLDRLDGKDNWSKDGGLNTSGAEQNGPGYNQRENPSPAIQGNKLPTPPTRPRRYNLLSRLLRRAAPAMTRAVSEV